MVETSSNTSLHRLGSRCRNLSICQPPASAVEIYERCEHCEDRYDEIPREVGQVTPSNGAYITVGDRYSATIRTRIAHRRKCEKPKAKADISVEFRGAVTLRQSDPIMVLRQQRDYAKENYAYRYYRWDNQSESD